MAVSLEEAVFPYQECSSALKAMHEEREEHGVHQRPHSRTEVDKVLGAIVVHTSLLQDAGHKVSSIARK